MPGAGIWSSKHWVCKIKMIKPDKNISNFKTILCCFVEKYLSCVVVPTKRRRKIEENCPWFATDVRIWDSILSYFDWHKLSFYWNISGRINSVRSHSINNKRQLLVEQIFAFKLVKYQKNFAISSVYVLGYVEGAIEQNIYLLNYWQNWKIYFAINCIRDVIFDIWK